MLLRFTTPDLARLDDLDSEVLVAGVYSDARPAHGVAGLCDWRLGGRLSRLMREGFVTGAAGEVVMIPGKPRLRFDKLVFFGLGERGAFDADRFSAFVAGAATALVRLRTRAAVIELPGRRERKIEAVRAVETLLRQGEANPDLDQWTLVEDAEGRAAMETHLSERRRRVHRTV